MLLHLNLNAKGVIGEVQTNSLSLKMENYLPVWFADNFALITEAEAQSDEALENLNRRDKIKKEESKIRE